MNAPQVRHALRQVASAEKAQILARFFKTGKGEYGEGDRFIGVVVPDQRKIVRRYFADRSIISLSKTLSTVRELLRSKFHEERLTALLILVEQYKQSNDTEKKRIFDFYLENLSHINNWDMVDLSAPSIVGAYLLDKDSSILFSLANSEHLWTRRVAVLATFTFIRAGRFEELLTLAESMLFQNKEEHDLIHKAIGWMLREVGKRNQQVLELFLDRFAVCMPRIALRYSIEKFPEPVRLRYLHAVR